MMEQQLRTSNKNMRNPDIKKAALGSCNSSRKQSRKGANPTYFNLTMEQSSKFGFLTCRNPACGSTLSIDDAFCRRCSCCLCHQFDDNKDSSLWLVCGSESAPKDSCGLSCHIECAFQQGKVGVVNLGQFMQLDGNHWCASCGKVSSILGCWKKQLVLAKDAWRIDVLCYRMFLSYRLLDGTSRFKELHEIVKEAKLKLEAEVGSLDVDIIKMARGSVSRLAVANDVQKLCSHAIDEADEWLANVSSGHSNSTVDSLPTACRFFFEEVTSSSLVIVLIKRLTPLTDHIKGYKLWFCKSRDDTPPKEPFFIPRENNRILVEELQPCTEYFFRIVGYTEAGDLGYCMSMCSTKSAEIGVQTSSPAGPKTENAYIQGSSSNAGEHQNSNPATEQCCGATKHESRKDHHSLPVSPKIDLNVVVIPDLNEDLDPHLESSRDEDNRCTLERMVIVIPDDDDDDASHGIDKNGLARANDGWPSDDSKVCALTPNGDVPAVNSLVQNPRKRASSTNEETHNCNNTLINGTSFQYSSKPNSLDEDLGNCEKVFQWLEWQGLIEPEFRLKLLTWLSLESTEKEHRIVNTYIETLFQDPETLARQLVDTFGDIMSSKKPRNHL